MNFIIKNAMDIANNIFWQTNILPEFPDPITGVLIAFVLVEHGNIVLLTLTLVNVEFGELMATEDLMFFVLLTTVRLDDGISVEVR